MTSEDRYNVTVKYITDAIMFEKSVINDDLPTMTEESRFEDVLDDLHCRAHEIDHLFTTIKILHGLKDVLDNSCKHPNTNNPYCPDCGDRI